MAEQHEKMARGDDVFLQRRAELLAGGEVFAIDPEMHAAILERRGQQFDEGVVRAGVGEKQVVPDAPT